MEIINKDIATVATGTTPLPVAPSPYGITDRRERERGNYQFIIVTGQWSRYERVDFPTGLHGLLLTALTKEKYFRTSEQTVIG